VYGCCIWSCILHRSEIWPVRKENENDRRMCGVQRTVRQVLDTVLRDRLRLEDETVSLLQRSSVRHQERQVALRG